MLLDTSWSDRATHINIGSQLSHQPKFTVLGEGVPLRIAAPTFLVTTASPDRKPVLRIALASIH